MNYKPYDCEICKCCEEKWNPLYDYSNVICMKYQVEISTYPRSLSLNDKVYENLKSACQCDKCYPSKINMFFFKIDSLIKKYKDKKYYRNEL